MFPSQQSRAPRSRKHSKRLRLEPLEPRRVLATMGLVSDAAVAAGADTERMDGRSIAGGTLVVDNAFDFVDGVFSPGELSLREAVMLSNTTPGTQSITFDSAAVGGTLDLAVQLNVTDSVTITGPADSPLRLRGDGGNRIFYLYDGDPNSEIDVTIQALELTEGSVVSGGGGAILSRENLTLIDSVVRYSQAQFGGGLSHFGGNLTVTGSSFVGNTATAHGGGLQFSMFGGQSAFIENSSVHFNSAGEAGGGISSFDGGGNVSIRQSTITDNETFGAGIGGGGMAVLQGSATVLNSIIALNTDDSGQAVDASTGLNIRYSFVGDNTGSGIFAGQPSAEFNIVGTGAAPRDPLLKGLAWPINGALSRAPLANSPVINGGTNLMIFPAEYDQRGAPFIRNAGLSPDMGAIEFNDDLQLVVTTFDDESDFAFDANDLSLREALRLSSYAEGATISFDTAGKFAVPRTISLTEGTLFVLSDVVIGGPGSDRLTLDGMGSTRVLFSQVGAIAELRGLTFTGGFTTSNGGGIYNAGRLTIQDSLVTGNRSLGPGFYQGRGGGIYNRGTLVVTDSTIEGNTGTASGGGIDSDGILELLGSTVENNFSNNGGGISSYDFARITESTITGNRAGDGGGVYVRSGIFQSVDSTISSNSATANGGGVRVNSATYASIGILQSTVSGNSANAGGGLSMDDGTAFLRQTTVSGNTATLGGGIDFAAGMLYIDHSTITRNVAYAGGGGVLNNAPIGSLVVDHSVVAQNFSVLVPELNDPVINYSLIGDSLGSGLSPTPPGMADANGNIVGGIGVNSINAQLGILAGNGGPTLTHAPLNGSPAIDSGDPILYPGGGATPFFDQRGDPYSRVQNGRIDMGSVEVAASVVDGDFNDDGVYDCFDIDALVAEIAAGTNVPSFDLTTDGAVDLADRDAWLAEAAAFNLPPGSTPFLVGDATLNGFVDGADFAVWSANKFTSGSGWCGADFNADGLTDGRDFLLWNANKFLSSKLLMPTSKRPDAPSALGETDVNRFEGSASATNSAIHSVKTMHPSNPTMAANTVVRRRLVEPRSRAAQPTDEAPTMSSESALRMKPLDRRLLADKSEHR